MTTTEGICRLCFNLGNNFEALDHNKIEALKLISLNLDFSLTKTPLVCSKCRDNIYQSYNFKKGCLRNEDALKSCLHSDCTIKLTLEEVVLRNVVEDEIKCEEEIVCRLCLNYVDSNLFMKNDNVEEDMFLRDMLRKCLSEIDLSITNQPKICYSCMEKVQNHFNFLMTCLGNEEEIKNYMLFNEKHNKDEIDLSDVLKYIDNTKNVSQNVDGSSCDAIVKQEELDQIEVGEFHIKVEENYLTETQNGHESDGYEKVNEGEVCLETFQSQYCSYTGDCKANLNNHEKESSHLKAKKRNILQTFHCIKCNYKTNDRCKLKMHIVTHEKKKPFECTKCLKKFIKKIQLEGHILRDHKDLHHLIDAKIYKCEFDMCTYKTVNETYLARHVKRTKHLKLKESSLLKTKNLSQTETFHCTKCDYKTHNIYHFNNHLGTHDENKPFECTKCLKKFIRRIQLEGHILRYHKDLHHLIESKIYSCESCTYKTVVKSDLLQHTSIDSSKVPKKYKCDCGFSCFQKCVLMNHLSTHATVHPFKCVKCNKDFNRKISLDTHTLHIHSEDAELLKTITHKVHSCGSCSYKTMGFGDLKRHMTNHCKNKVMCNTKR